MIKYKDKELILSYYKDNEIKGLIYTDNIIFGNVNLSEWEECQIEQVGWTVDLNNQWELSTVRQDTDTNFQTYQSFSNKGVNNGWARMKVNIAKGLSEFTLHFGSYAESNYDFTLVGNLDANMSTSTSTSTGTTSTTWKQTSSGKQSANAPDIVVKYDIADTSKEHYIWIAYKKDGSVNSNDDRGYVSFDKRLVQSFDGFRKKEYSYSAQTVSDFVYDFYLTEKWVYSEDKETIIKEDPLTATTEQLETRLIDGEVSDTFRYERYIYYKKYYQVKLNNQWLNTDYYTFGDIKEEMQIQFIDYVYNNDALILSMNQYPDENTIVQLKYYHIDRFGGFFIGCDGETDSNYRWRYFHYSNSIYFDAYGTRTNGASNQGLTGVTYEREMGYDSSTNTKYVKNITERDTIVGSTGTNLISSTSVNMSKAGFSPSYKFNIFHDNTMRVYYMKIYKNGVMVNNYRPVKFSDGTYGLYDMITHDEVKDARLLGSE